MPFFKDLPSNPNFPELELAVLNWWTKNDTLNQYLHKNDSLDTTFSFIDGPITANGPMGVHHARGRTLKDLFQRYKNAQGFAQRFQNGFDCQGLWVEVEVEKDHGFNSKKDITSFGLDKFTTACLDRVNKFSLIQTEQSRRLGMFMDWDNSYYTNSTDNNLYIWHFLKVVHSKGWLVKRKSATTWCPRCETGLSQHEQADGYKDVTDTSVYVKFQLADSKNEYVLAWTTTPWTLATNVLLAINTEYQYVKACVDHEYWYLAKESADRLGINDYQLIDAKTLINKKFLSLYDIPVQKNINHYICEWNLVNPSEGTGVVHIAPGGGQDDFELGKKLGADMITAIDETGHFIDGFGDLSGQYAHDVAPAVFEYLKSIGSLFKTEAITHRYPHCWRCKTKCLFRLEDSWYIKSDEIRPRMKAAALQVDWHPKYVGRRMQNWLDSMEDWMISRKRFYGLALPFYECSCGQLTVTGSREELKSLALDPSQVDALPSLHRPWIDSIEIKCPQCSQSVHRVPDVGDCWLDAGVVPFSTLKYLTDKQYWQKWFPADLVLEMIEQVRLWFYSMLFFSVTLEETFPYRHVVAHAEVRDEKGERMSKTKKNGIPYDEAVSQMGADAMRWLYCQQTSYTNVNFGFNIADGVKKEFFLILWNSYRFFTQHANLQVWQPQPNLVPATTNVLDQWIMSRLHNVIKTTTVNLDKFRTATATKTVEGFVSDLSTWYIRRSRDRNDNSPVLYYLFETLSCLIAPFTPFLSEIIFQNLHGSDLESASDTVHLHDWPKFDDKLINTQLESSMTKVRTLCQMIHAQRQLANIKIRQPLAQATLNSNDTFSPDLVEIISQETNVKSIVFNKTSAPISVNLDTHLTPELLAEGEYRDLVRQVQILRKEQGMSLTDRIVITAPTWPTNFESEITKKTLADSLVRGEALSIKKI